MDEMQKNTVTVSEEFLKECLEALAAVKALKCLVSCDKYIGRKEVAAVCGFEVKEER